MANELNDELRFLATNRGFLGREFLTWLWYKTEHQNHKINIPEKGEFRFFVDDKITLSSSSGSVRESSLKGGTPAFATEAGTALLAGKLVQEAKFILQDTERQWSFLLTGEDLAIKNLRLPSISEPDSQTHISHRIVLIKMVTEIIDHLYKMYLDLRFSKDFENELLNMRTWMTTKVTG